MPDWLQKLQDNFPSIQTDKYFSNLTTLEVGGPITAFIEVTSKDKLTKIIKYSNQNSIPFLIIGGGSNLLVSDTGFNGLVIKNNLSYIKAIKDTVVVGAGTSLQELVNYSIHNHLIGLQKMTGIPGTVGGAVYGNAAAYGQTISEFIYKVQVFDGEKFIELNKKDCGFDYRDSNFKKTKYTILEISFKFTKTTQDLKKQSREVLEKRVQKYPPGIKCPGSFFKNILIKNIPSDTQKLIPENRDYYGKVPAWFFLDEVGIKGQQLGQIKVKENHGNTFINLGNGTAQDFYNLAKIYYLKVKDKFGIELEPEVQLINLPPFNK